jgi:trimeric autotransporter adhesin
MSTKTLRKRIALVAVVALGAGVLVTSPANAAAGNAIDNTHINMTAATTGTAALGVCFQAAGATDADVSSATTTSTTTVIEVGAKLSFTTVTNGTGSLVISGSGTWTAVDSTGTISSDRKTVNTVSISTTAATLTAGAAGSLTVTAYSAADGGGTAVETYGITVAASCAGNAISVANTVAVLAAANGTAADGNTDFTPTAGEVDNGSDVWINVLLRDAYKNPLTTAGVLTANATNGARIGWVDGGVTGPFAATTAVIATLGDSAASSSLKVMQPADSSAAINTTVTIQFNGVTIATKTVSISGAPASIAVTDVTVGTQNSTGTFKYVVKDAAGNQLTSTSVGTSAIAGFKSAGVVSSATTASSGDATWIAKGTGTFACAASKSGSQSVTIAFLNSALQPVASNAFTATCGYAAVDTFSVSTDKATYSPGEIATLTISAKDEKGGIVSDTTTVGSAIVNLAMPGMTLIGAAATSSDVFTSGVKTYKFRVDQAEGSFVGQAQVTAATDLAVKTVSYTVKSTSNAVSNADVLKAIVSLIASINKQIAALQKALLKR